MITKIKQTTKGTNSFLRPKNQQGYGSTHYVIIFLLVASGLLHACSDYPTIPAAAPGFSDMFFKTYRSFAALGVVPKGISLDSVSDPSNVPDSSRLILRRDNTYSMKAKFSITVKQGSRVDTLTYRIDEQGELQVKSANYQSQWGDKGWVGNVRFTPANGIAWECQYMLVDWESMAWVLTLWGPIWLPDSSFVTGFNADQ
jgi:hypothetical protein